jgi:hypothetical protein
MPELITLPDGSVRWDYDSEDKPKKAAKKAASPAKSTTEEGA